MRLAHGQTGYQVRFDWGLDGAHAMAAHATITVVVDVLSYTTTLTVALDAGTSVYPYRWNDGTAEQYARQRGAVPASWSPSSRTRASPTRRSLVEARKPNGHRHMITDSRAGRGAGAAVSQ